MTTYQEFRLRIERGQAKRTYQVVAGGPAGEARGQFTVPFSDVELENFVLRVGQTRRGKRRIDSPQMELAKTMGTKLFDAVFAGEIRELYRAALAEANAAGDGVRLSLAMTGAPELLQVPWEYLYDRPNFLSISTWTPVVRYLDLAKAPPPFAVALPLRVLGMVSLPDDAELLKVDDEKAKLESALAPLITSGAVAIDWLTSPTLPALTRQLRREDYHVFHFIGHGGFDTESKDGVLLLEDEKGRSELVTGARLGDILHDEKTLRLAVLNACEGARASIEDPFSGVATSLIEREIPAVIGMQFEITDEAAIVFASEFYSTLSDGQPVDAAISEARKSIYAMGNDIEWGTPVLFMRVQDGRLFDVQPHLPVPRPDPMALVAEVTAPTAAAPIAAALGVAIPLIADAPAAGVGAVPDVSDPVALGRNSETEVLREPAIDIAERERVEAEEAAEIAERERIAEAEAAERRRAADAAERARVAAAAEAAERRRAAAEAAEQAWRPVTPPSPEPATRPSKALSRRGPRMRWVWLVLPVLAVSAIGLNGLIASPGPTDGPISAIPTPKPTTVPKPTAAPVDPNAQVRPPNIYNKRKQEGLDALASAGFTNVQPATVCSGSVAAGFVRQVVINDGSAAGSERIVIDKAGTLRAVALSTPLMVKIGSGKSC